MKGRVYYKQPNSVKVEVKWKYNDYRKEMSILEYNDYNIKIHFDWLVKMIKHTFRYGRRNYPISQQPFHIDEGKRLLPKSVKREVTNQFGDTYTVCDNVLTKEEEKHNDKVRIKEEANRRIRNKVNTKKQRNSISTLIRIVDCVDYQINGMYNTMKSKWYVERIHFYYRELEPTYGGEKNSWKEIIHIESNTYNCLVDLTDYLMGISLKWCKKSCHYALEKYFKPIRDKYNIDTMENFSLITQKLGDDYIRYLKRIQIEDDKKEEWNEEFEELFNETTTK